MPLQIARKDRYAKQAAKPPMEHQGRTCSRAHLLIEIERQSSAIAAASDKTVAASATAGRGADRLLQAPPLQLLQKGLGGGGQLGDAGGILNLRRGG